MATATGWYYSRFGQVLVQRVASPSNGYAYGENPDSVVVVAEDGCVSQQMKVRIFDNYYDSEFVCEKLGVEN